MAPRLGVSAFGLRRKRVREPGLKALMKPLAICTSLRDSDNPLKEC